MCKELICLFILLYFSFGQIQGSEPAYNYTKEHGFEFPLDIAKAEVCDNISSIESINKALDINSSVVRNITAKATGNYSDYCINKICDIYEYMIYGERCGGGWLYEDDSIELGDFSPASMTVFTGEKIGRSGKGDCDDFAILMASLITGTGGTARIMLTDDHMYTEVYLGKSNNKNTTDTLEWIKNKYQVEDLYCHRSNDLGIWLNLDYGRYPGSPFEDAKKNETIPIGKTGFLSNPILCPRIANPDYSVDVGSRSNIITAFDKKTNRTIWMKEHVTNIYQHNIIVCDLNNDADYETIVATQDPIAGNLQNVSGRLILYDKRGCKLDEYNTWKPTIYCCSDGMQSRVAQIQTADLNDDGKMEILVLSNDEYWFATRLIVLDIEGNKFNEIGVYWHPGYLYELYVVDVNGDGIKEVVCIGVNNDLQNIYSLNGNVYVAFAFNGSNISGQAPPWWGDEAVGIGTELWYYFLNKNDSLVRISDVRFQEDKNGDGIRDFQICLDNSCSWFLDYHGELIGRGYGSLCRGETRDFAMILTYGINMELWSPEIISRPS